MEKVRTRSAIGKSNRERGKEFERELAKYFRDRGYNTYRGQQFCGKNGAADVVGLPNIHIEAKYRDNLNVRDALEQAKGDALEGNLPTAFWKKPRKGTVVIMSLDDWTELYGYMADFKRLCAWHEVDDYGNPPEPVTDYSDIGKVHRDDVQWWIEEHFEPYLAWAKGVSKPYVYYYAGEDRWVNEHGHKIAVERWKELPTRRDMTKMG